MATRGRRSRRRRGAIRIDFEFDPDPRELAKRFDFLKKEIMDLRPAWKRMLPKMRMIAGRQTSSRGAVAGSPWPPWKESYAKRRPSGAMLVLSGRLVRQLTADGKVSLTRRAFRFGVQNLPYARAVYFGSPKQGIRPRPFIVATRDVSKLAAREVNRNTEEVLAKFPIRGGRSAATAIARGKQR